MKKLTSAARQRGEGWIEAERACSPHAANISNVINCAPMISMSDSEGSSAVERQLSIADSLNQKDADPFCNRSINALLRKVGGSDQASTIRSCPNSIPARSAEERLLACVSRRAFLSTERGSCSNGKDNFDRKRGRDFRQSPLCKE
jgi:hypothetical protein